MPSKTSNPMQLILAPPGAGKTRHLVTHIQARLAEGVSPFRLLATTFSRQAARELAQRLEGDVPVRTVHSLALWVVRLAARARGSRLPRVLPPEQARTRMAQVLRETGSAARFIAPEEALAALAFVRERGGSSEALHPVVRQVVARYQAQLAQENLLDFTGILEQARQELAQPELQHFLAGLHLLVDEGQDLNPRTEWPVLDGFRQSASAFLMMASPSQQIYGFKGAHWETLASHFPAGTRIDSLEYNYRSTPEIIEASRALAGADARQMRAVRASLHVPVVRAACLDAALEMDWIGRTLTRWQQAGIPFEEIAVLTRSHALQHPIQRMLHERGLPFQVVGERPDLYQCDEVRAALGYLTLALDPQHPGVLEQIIDTPPVGVGTRLRYRLRGEASLNWSHLRQALEAPAGYPTAVLERIQRLLAFREQGPAILAQPAPPSHALARLLALTDLPDMLAAEGDFAGLRALEELQRAAQEFDSLAAFQQDLAEKIRAARLPAGVQLATLHASKGREWRAVLLPNLQDGVLPLHDAPRQEEQNLAFVGLTRARDVLALTLSRQARPSPFLAGLPAEVVTWP